MKKVLLSLIFSSSIFGFGQITVGTYTGITQLSNITSTCDPIVNTVLGDIDFATNSGVEIAIGTSFSGTWANGMAYSDGPGPEILCVSVHTEEWWDVELYLSNFTYTPAVNAAMLSIEDYITLDFWDCAPTLYTNYYYDRRVVTLDFSMFAIPAGLQVIGARFTLAGDNAANPDPIGMLYIGNTPDPTPTVTNNGPICLGDTIEFDLTAEAGSTYSWTGPLGFVSTLEDPTITNGALANAGIYTCYVTSPLGDIDTITSTFSFHPTPDANAGLDMTITCLAPTVNLNASSTTPGANYVWAGPGITAGGSTASPTINSVGSYTVTVTDPVTGCTSTDIADVTISNDDPTAAFSADFTSSCAPLCLTLTDASVSAISPIVSWSWNVENQPIVATSNNILCLDDAGVYDVTLTVTAANGCTSSLSIPNYLSVYTNSTAGFTYGPDNITEFEPLAIFVNTSVGADSYLWDFGDGSTSTSANASHTFADTGVYCVTLISNTANSCNDTITHCLYIEPEFSVFIPNSFTANKDGLNETWTIYGRGLNNFEARIFNSWGEELYLFNSVDKGWNGNRLNGTACPQGVYVYKVFITDNKGDVHEFYGNLNLIR